MMIPQVGVISLRVRLPTFSLSCLVPEPHTSSALRRLHFAPPEKGRSEAKIVNLCVSLAAGGGADDYSSVHYCWDEEFVHEKYEMINLKIIHRRHRTGFEECKDIAIHVNDLIAGRYQVPYFPPSPWFFGCMRRAEK